MPRVVKCILFLIVVGLMEVSCDDRQKHIAKAYAEMKHQADSLSLSESFLKYTTGSSTIDSLSFDNPFRIRYVYNDISNSGFSVYRIVNGKADQVPFIIETESEQKALYITERWSNVTLKIVTSGAWAMSFEEYGKGFRPTLTDLSVDSLIYKSALDSLLTTLFIEYETSDTTVVYEDLTPLTQRWRQIDHRRGSGEYETDWFYLPECSVRIQSFFDPIQYSSGCSISLEGEGRNQSWYGLNVGMYDWKTTHKSEKVFKVPAGRYFINADGEGIWEYIVSVCY